MIRHTMPLLLLLAACEGSTIKFPDGDTAAPDTDTADTDTVDTDTDTTDTGDTDTGDTDLPNIDPFVGASPLDDADITLYAESRNDVVGYKGSLAAGGDLTGDGTTDLLVGARGASSEDYAYAGAVYVVSNPPSGESSLAEAHTRIFGETQSSGFGTTVSSAGDVDGDGNLDFIVGSPGYGISRAYIFHGPIRRGDMNAADADTILASSSDQAYAGSTVSAAGDLDGDGRDDVIVGASQDNSGCSGCGAVYVSLAADTPGGALLEDDSILIYGDHVLGQVGYAESKTLDLDGDGSLDVAVGSPYSASGGVGLFYGPFRAGSYGLGSADAWFAGENLGAYIGASLASVDLDDDGYQDLVIGAPYESSDTPYSGRIYIQHGGPDRYDEAQIVGDGTVFHGNNGEYAGSALSPAGDVDGDGTADLLITASYAGLGGSYAGATYLVYGPVSRGEHDLADTSAVFYGTTPSGMAGDSLASPLDINGDGSLDLGFGAINSADLGTGAVYVFLGR